MALRGGFRRALRTLLLALAVTALTAPATASALEPRIIGGSAVSILDHPYQVRVLINHSGGTFQCGGSIRDATHVITGAHCVVDEEGGVYPEIVGPSAVEVGYSSASQDNLLSVAVSRVSVAPGYLRDGTLASDAAVLTLAAPIDLPGDPEAEAIPFASLAELDTAFASSASGFATGWGATAEGGDTSMNLLGVALPLRPGSACAAVYGQEYDDSVMLCAGGAGNLPSGNQDTCQGDSGGPLAIDTNADPNVETYELVGITSFGNGCGRPNTPGAYARVQSSALLPFLSAPNPVAPPPAPASNPTISGTLRVGQNITCNAPPVAGATPTRYLWFVVDDGNFALADVTSGPTFQLPAELLGAFLVCDVRYENPGGFRYVATPEEARVGPVLAPLPPPTGAGQTGGGGAATNPPPAVVADRARPRARITSVRCARRRCKIKVSASDSGGSVRSLSARLNYTVKRCRRVAGRRRCRTVKKTKRLRPARSRGGFTITTRLGRGRYTASVVATDTSNNRSSVARRTFRVR